MQVSETTCGKISHCFLMCYFDFVKKIFDREVTWKDGEKSKTAHHSDVFHANVLLRQTFFHGDRSVMADDIWVTRPGFSLWQPVCGRGA